MTQPTLETPRKPRSRNKPTPAAQPLRVLLLAHEHLVPPADATATAGDPPAYQAELDVRDGLRSAGHEVAVVGVSGDLRAIAQAVTEFKPHVAFNLIESFHDFRSYDQHVVSYLECLRQPYTGCNPRGLTLARDKALTKKILAYHHVAVPGFRVYPIGRPIRPPRSAKYPLLVKSATDDGSVGIALASLVTSESALRERVEYIHAASGTDAIAEQYIEGRELYVGVIGNRAPLALPVWELDLSNLPDSSPRIVTERMKTDDAYLRRHRIESGPAELTADAARNISTLAVRIYRHLGLTGYARLDLRMTPAGNVYLIEANPNPQIARKEDFALSAKHAGIDYPVLLGRLLSLARRYSPRGQA